MATALAWNLATQDARAVGAAGEDTAYSYLLLVCVANPSLTDRKPAPTSKVTILDGPGNDDVTRRMKTDTFIATGPTKQETRKITTYGCGEYEITSTPTTECKLQRPDGNGGWDDWAGQTTTRTAEEVQKVAGQMDRTLIWRAKKAVADNLTDEDGSAGQLQGSSVCGGTGIAEGTTKVSSALEGTTGGFGITFGVGYGGASLKVDVVGTMTADTLDWSGSDCEWGFEVMTQEAYEKWLNSQ